MFVHLIQHIQPYLDWRNDINGVSILWSLRIGVVLIVLGWVWPSRDRRKLLLRALQVRNDGYQTSRFTDQLESMTRHPAIRWVMLQPESDDYVKIESLIRQAGGLKGLTPNIVQMAKVLLPPILFVGAGFIYWMNFHFAEVSYQQSLLHPKTSSGTNLFLFTPTAVHHVAPRFSFIVLMWIAVGAFLVYMVPEMMLKFAIRNREKQMTKELHLTEQFIVTLIEAKMTVYEILNVLKDTTVLLKPFIAQCINEYYVIGPKVAIDWMADRVGNSEFRVMCNVLEQAVVNTNEYTLPFLQQHMRQFEQLEHLQEERKIRMKPMYYTMVLGMPLGGVMVTYFFPFLTKALAMLHSF